VTCNSQVAVVSNRWPIICSKCYVIWTFKQLLQCFAFLTVIQVNYSSVISDCPGSCWMEVYNYDWFPAAMRNTSCNPSSVTMLMGLTFSAIECAIAFVIASYFPWSICWVFPAIFRNNVLRSHASYAMIRQGGITAMVGLKFAVAASTNNYLVSFKCELSVHSCSAYFLDSISDANYLKYCLLHYRVKIINRVNSLGVNHMR